ncbi:MAG: MoxR family ATPase [SAR324 cluster bacterium]|nr:MoxR family ATPase [SAR324 cluster bacterium]
MQGIFPTNPQEIKDALAVRHYIASDQIATVMYLAIKMKKPLLVEGPAGVGKTELAKCIAQAMNLEFIRLQCYEGLDESKALYEWEYAKQLLYIQILKEKISDTLAHTQTINEAVKELSSQEDAFFSEKFLLNRPLLKSLRSPQRCVLLIDEVDKSDPEFEAFLLEFLSDFAVTIPELGTIQAIEAPVVLLTSNDQRDLSDALKRRCLHLFIDYPTLEIEQQIIAAKVPEANPKLLSQTLEFVHKVRKLDLKKTPSISESIDWIQSLLLLQLKEWNHADIRHTLSVLLKYQSDVELVRKQLL